jgi:hypothetical protein
MNLLTVKALFAAAVLGLAPAIACAEDGAAVTTRRVDEAPPSIEAADPLPTERWYPEDAIAPPFDRRPHGEVEVAIGTGGYREAAGTIVVPLGERGYVAAGIVMIDQGSRGRRAHRDAGRRDRPPTSP